MSRRRLLPWLLAAVAATSAAAPQTGLARQSSQEGVNALVRQAAFWRERGRKDLAGQSLQRALAADPKNADALAAMARYAREDGDVAGAERWTARLRRAAPNDPRLRQLAAPVAAPPSARPAPPPVAAAAAPPPAPRPAAPVDRGGPLRAAGFAALEKGQLDAAARDFEAALRIRPGDQDALGGLGVVRLRQERFAEAEPLLAKASAGSPQAKARWREALASARFYGGLRAAQAALAAGDAAKAERLVAPLANGSGRDVALAQQLLGDALARQGRLAEAEAAYRQAARNAPDSPDIQTGLVEALVAQGKIAEAEALAARTPGGATGSVSTRARIAQARADEAWAAGDLTGARAAFETALAAFPSEPWLRLDYARFLLERGETSSADGLMSPLASSVGAEPLHAAALWADRRNRPRDGLAALEKIPPAERTAQMDALAQSLRDRAVIQQARQAAAGRGYEAASGLRALLARPGLPIGTAGEAASALYDLGDVEPALAAAQQALVVDVPAAPAAYEGFVSVLAKAGRDAEAAALIRQASTKAAPTPENRRAVAGLTATLAAERADRLRLSGDLAGAFDTLSEASTIAPDNPRILAALGRLYLTGRMPDEARQAYEALLRLKPGDPEALAGIAEAALALNDLPGARDNLRLAMARSPDNADFYLLKARIETAAGDRRAALEALQTAKALGAHGGGVRGQTGGLGPNPFLNRSSSPSPARPAAPVAWLSPTSTPMEAPAAASPWAAPPPGVGPAAPAAPPSSSSSLFGFPSFPVAKRSPAPVATTPQETKAAGIDRQIADLRRDAAPQIDVSTTFRQRSGEAGLSQLGEVAGVASFSTSVLGRGRLSFEIAPTAIDGGTASLDGRQRFGANPIPTAVAILDQEQPVPPGGTPIIDEEDVPDPGPQTAAGAALTVRYAIGGLTADVGATPLGFSNVEAAGGVSWAPAVGGAGRAKLKVERRPVTDSVTSYAATVDPVTGKEWGQVMRSTVGGGLSYDNQATGLYADLSASRYDGRHVADNSGWEMNIGGYIRPYRTSGAEFQIGANLNHQAYDNNQNLFTLGHGGYFSPQQFTSVSLPMQMRLTRATWNFELRAAPGYQTYREDAADVFPLDPALQGTLESLASIDRSIKTRFPARSESGFGMAGSAAAEYQMGWATTVGGALSFDTFGDYDEAKARLYLKQLIGGRQAP
ncbi:cellulose synthase subunit BcsC-related outer membrane protein [Caulobacter sp. Root487D2Y]|uniref:cellulose synthase subunit BcsC-related outer membrane protein n=1 Tax=Caulobacter sp. Root487D2Y TaxID=1736547 RepID=UPI0009EC3A83|nr:cellulose synthase subunit BcsC-related outer membrane protein [Caulobacter sp. Root487D2Y]